MEVVDDQNDQIAFGFLNEGICKAFAIACKVFSISAHCFRMSANSNCAPTLQCCVRASGDREVKAEIIYKSGDVLQYSIRLIIIRKYYYQ